MWVTINIAAGRSCGTVGKMSLRALIAPAEPPITTILDIVSSSSRTQGNYLKVAEQGAGHDTFPTGSKVSLSMFASGHDRPPPPAPHDQLPIASNEA
jgi:hypothetical protein